MISVVQCGRHALVSAILRRAFEASGMRVEGDVSDVPGLMELCARRRPDVAVAVVTEGDDITAVASRLIALDTRLLVLGDDVPAAQVQAMLLAGAAGYLVLRDTPPHAVATSVRSVASGHATLHPVAAAAILEQWRQMRNAATTPVAEPRRLTQRELQVLAAAAQGLTTSAIASRLKVAVKTVENHKTRIFAKLGVRTQAQAVAVATSSGLLSPAPATVDRHVPAATVTGSTP